MTAAMLAVNQNHLYILKCLHLAGADLRLSNLLYAASVKGYSMIVSYLLENKVYPNGNVQYDTEETPIQAAIRTGHFDAA